MGKPTKKATKRMARAAHVLVRGASWTRVAAQLGYKTEDTAREELACRHPNAWRRAYEFARTLHDDEAVAEADIVQRELLRQQIVRCNWQGEPIEGENGQPLTIDHSPQVRQSAANSIKTHAARTRLQGAGGSDDRPALPDLFDFANNRGMLEDDTDESAQVHTG